MSTKIYEGFVFHGSISDVIKFMKTYRKQAQVITKNRNYDGEIRLLLEFALSHGIYERSLKESLVRILPNKERISPEMLRALTEEVMDDPGNLFSMGQIAQAWIRFNKQESSCAYVNPSFDNRFSVYLFPDGDKTYGVPFGNMDLITDFLHQPEIHDYSYWNNSDRPDNISSKKWQERKECWDRMLPSGIPSVDGVEYAIKDFFVPTLTEKTVDDWLNKNRDEELNRQVIHSAIIKKMETQQVSDHTGYFKVRDQVLAEKESHSEFFQKIQMFWEDHYPHDYYDILNLLKDQ